MAMSFDTPRCAICGELARGTLECTPGVALLTFSEHGDAHYEGGTEMDWDGQTTCRDARGRVTLECVNGHRWPSRPDNQSTANEERTMPTYEVEQYELHVMKYRIEAPSEAEAIAKVFRGEAEPVGQSQEFIEVAEDFGLAAEEHRDLVAALRTLGVSVPDAVIPSIRSVQQV